MIEDLTLEDGTEISHSEDTIANRGIVVSNHADDITSSKRKRPQTAHSTGSIVSGQETPRASVAEEFQRGSKKQRVDKQLPESMVTGDSSSEKAGETRPEKCLTTLMDYFKESSTSAIQSQVTATHRLPGPSQSNVSTTASASQPAAVPSPFRKRDLFSSLPTPKDGKRLTRSQRLFSAMTKIPYQSLTINSDDEFFLFMDMRADAGWATFNMSSRKYAEATEEFNSRMGQKARAKGMEFVAKNPRALMEKLAAIEEIIMNRLSTENFVCKLHGR